MPQSKTSSEIFCDRFLALTDDEALALRYLAKRYIGGTRFSSPEDLIQEAVTRTIEGARIYPVSIDVGRYMRGVMRSVAWAERTRKERTLMEFGSFEELEEMDAARFDLAGWDAEEEVDKKLAMEQLEAALIAARSHFSSDEDALRVIDSMLAGLLPREACRQFAMEMNAYRAARQRALGDLRRRMGASSR